MASTGNQQNTIGIQCNQEQLLYGNCKMDYYAVLGIRQGEINSPETFMQDVILASTSFIGTIATI